MKKNLFLLLVAIIVSLNLNCNVSAVASSSITIIMNGEIINFDEALPIVDGTTYVPLRSIFEKYGISANWDDSTKTVTVAKENIKAIYALDYDFSNPKYKYYNPFIIYDKLIIKNDKAYVPLRAIELFGAVVKYDFSTRTAYISTTQEGFPSVDKSVGLTSSVLAGDWIGVTGLNRCVIISDDAMDVRGWFDAGRYTYKIEGNKVYYEDNYTQNYFIWDSQKDVLISSPDHKIEEPLTRNHGIPIDTTKLYGKYSIDDGLKYTLDLVDSTNAIIKYNGNEHKTTWGITRFDSNYTCNIYVYTIPSSLKEAISAIDDVNLLEGDGIEFRAITEGSSFIFFGGPGPDIEKIQ